MNAGRHALERALDLIYGSRRDAYGDALVNHERIARLATARFHEKLKDPVGDPFTPEDMAAFARMQKEARLVATPGHVDSLTDIAGYAGVELDIHAGRAARIAAIDLEIEDLHGKR